MKTVITNLLFFIFLSSTFAQNQDYIDSLLNDVELMRIEKRHKDEAFGYYLIANEYDNNGDYDKSEQYYGLALDVCEKWDIKEYMGHFLNDIGSIHQFKGDYETSMKYFIRALKVEESISNGRGISKAQYNIAATHYYIKDYDKSLYYINQAIAWERKHRDSTEHIAFDLVLRALILLELDSLESAEQTLQETISIHRRLGDSVGLAVDYSNMGDVLIKAKAHLKALEYFKRALALEQNYGTNPRGRAIISGNIGEQYLILGLHDSAKIYVLKSIKIAEEMELKETMKSGYDILSALYKETKQYELALAYYSKYVALDHELLNLESTNRIKNLEADYELDKEKQRRLANQQQIQILEAKRREDNLKIYGLAGGLILLAIILVLINRYQTRKRKTDKLLMKKEKQLEVSRRKYMAMELEKTTLDKKRLEDEVHYKNRELKKMAHHIVQKNDVLESVKQEISNGQIKDSLSQVKMLLSVGLDSDKEAFEEHVDHINALFYKNLTDQFPNLTENDLRLLSMLRLNLTSKDISIVLNISPSSVDMARYRLRKKLNIDKYENLSQFLSQF